MTLSTSSLNRYGYRVLTNGLRLENFRANPVMLFGHNTWMVPVGRWDDIKVEGDKLTAIPIFDENDAIGLALKTKMDNGFPLAASIAFKAIKTSSEASLILKGQTLETVTESEVLEASIVSVPGNADATLSYAHTLSAIQPITTTQNIMDFSKIGQALGVSADEATIIDAIKALKDDVQRLSADQVNVLIESGRQRGLINDNNEAHFRTLAAASPDAVRQIINAQPAPAAPAKQEQQALGAPAQNKPTLTGMLSAGGVKPDSPQGNPRDSWTYDDWSKKDPAGLLAMKKGEPEKYQKLSADRMQQHTV